MRYAGVAALLAAAVAAPCAGASPSRTDPLLGVKGDAARFQTLTGQASQVRHVIVGWDQGMTWGSPFLDLMRQVGGVPMIGLATDGRNGSEDITPQQIALGKGDDYLIALNGAISQFGQPILIRPFGEMNGYWNSYSAYTRAGGLKPGHQTSWFRKAFARVDLIVHGGPAAAIDAKLTALGMPPLAGGDLPANPAPETRVVWNPQGFGDPNIPGNSAQAYYPGNAYVDLVGDDLYDSHGKAEWAAADALYKAHPGKQFSFPEWGLWGIDDPAFIDQMATFVRTHRRTSMLAYYEGAVGSVFDLATKPKSLAAYRRVISPLG
jgi:hypothetical protein